MAGLFGTHSTLSSRLRPGLRLVWTVRVKCEQGSSNSVTTRTDQERSASPRLTADPGQAGFATAGTAGRGEQDEAELFITGRVHFSAAAGSLQFPFNAWQY